MKYPKKIQEIIDRPDDTQEIADMIRESGRKCREIKKECEKEMRRILCC